ESLPGGVDHLPRLASSADGAGAGVEGGAVVGEARGEARDAVHHRALEPQAVAVLPAHQRLAAYVDGDAAVLFLYRVEVDEAGEFSEQGVALVAQGVGAGAVARLGAHDLAVELRDLPGEAVAGFGQVRQPLAGAEGEGLKLPIHVIELCGEGLPLAQDDLAQSGVGRPVAELAPGVEEPAHRAGEVVVAQLVEDRLDLPEPFGVGAASLGVADARAQARHERLVDLPLHADEADAGAEL